MFCRILRLKKAEITFILCFLFSLCFFAVTNVLWHSSTVSSMLVYSWPIRLTTPAYNPPILSPSTCFYTTGGVFKMNPHTFSLCSESINYHSTTMHPACLVAYLKFLYSWGTFYLIFLICTLIYGPHSMGPSGTNPSPCT